MKFEFEKEFRADHPETIGETDREFDLYNYLLWLEKQLKNCNLQNVSNNEVAVCPRCASKDVIWTVYCNDCHEAM